MSGLLFEDDRSSVFEANCCIDDLVLWLDCKRLYIVWKLFENIRGARVYYNQFSGANSELPLIIECTERNKVTKALIFPHWMLLTPEGFKTFGEAKPNPETGDAAKEVLFDKLPIIPIGMRKKVME